MFSHASYSLDEPGRINTATCIALRDGAILLRAQVYRYYSAVATASPKIVFAETNPYLT
jgi:hypothetical protein